MTQQQEKSAVTDIETTPLSVDALPRPAAARAREFLADFRDLVRDELGRGERPLPVEGIRSVPQAVAKLARFVLKDYELEYSAENEARACDDLRAGRTAANGHAPQSLSAVHIVLDEGVAGAQRYLNSVAADRKNTDRAVESLASRLRIFFDLAEQEKWTADAAGTTLTNPRAAKIAWEKFPPLEAWLRRGKGEVSRGEGSRALVEAQTPILRAFLARSLDTFDLSMNPAAERGMMSAVRERGELAASSHETPSTLVEALIANGAALIDDAVASQPSPLAAGALRSFYIVLRDEMPEAFPAPLAEKLGIPMASLHAHLPLFDCWIKERVPSEAAPEARKDLQVFSRFLSLRNDALLIEADEQCTLIAGRGGKRSFDPACERGPITAALCAEPLESLREFREYLKTRSGFRPSYQHEAYSAAHGFLVWAAETKLIGVRPGAINAAQFAPGAAGPTNDTDAASRKSS